MEKDDLRKLILDEKITYNQEYLSLAEFLFDFFVKK